MFYEPHNLLDFTLRLMQYADSPHDRTPYASIALCTQIIFLHSNGRFILAINNIQTFFYKKLILQFLDSKFNYAHKNVHTRFIMLCEKTIYTIQVFNIGYLSLF